MLGGGRFVSKEIRAGPGCGSEWRAGFLPGRVHHRRPRPGRSPALHGAELSINYQSYDRRSRTVS